MLFLSYDLFLIWFEFETFKGLVFLDALILLEFSIAALFEKLLIVFLAAESFIKMLLLE